MSIFAAGGSVGFFLAPVLATPALVAWAGATALFLPPAIIALVLLRHSGSTTARRSGTAGISGGPSSRSPGSRSSDRRRSSG